MNKCEENSEYILGIICIILFAFIGWLSGESLVFVFNQVREWL